MIVQDNFGATPQQIYTVRDRDSLSKIALKFGITTRELIAANLDTLVGLQNQLCADNMMLTACPRPLPITRQSFNPNLIEVGWQLVIPQKPTPPPPPPATVQVTAPGGPPAWLPKAGIGAAVVLGLLALNMKR